MAGELNQNEFIRVFPRWYTPVKWGVPITVGVLSGLLFALMVMNVTALPASLAMLQWLPAMYQSLESLGAFTLLALSFGIVSTMSTMLISVLTRVCLYQYVENLAVDNLNGIEFMNKFRSMMQDKNKDGEAEKDKQQAELEDALVHANQNRQTLMQQNAVLQADNEKLRKKCGLSVNQTAAANDDEDVEEKAAARSPGKKRKVGKVAS